MSAPVNTATTPGADAAAAVSMLEMGGVCLRRAQQVGVRLSRPD